ncbi:hypothetical protein [Fusibacter ferrireducens]|uniref:DUF4240 domain-containing protein n=1 Tax=Fusibacter ferrireducens TaxID=2785058 RepID=A0ABR9ZZN1_9FIRM|nr:hypothetical protein [Fusibacter ferrireducens]MBF4695907.1 hypothetical protein [Fusibacter ferrireducens]
MNIEFKNEVIEKSKYKENWTYFSSIANDVVALDSIWEIVKLLAEMTDNLYIGNDEYGKKFVKFDYYLFEKVVILLKDFKNNHEVYNHITDYQLLFFLAEHQKKKWHTDNDYIISMISIAEKLEFIETIEIEKIKDTFLYKSLFWDSHRVHAYREINAKKDNFAYKISNEKLLVCTRNDNEFNSYQISSSNELFQDYEKLFELIKDNNAEGIKNLYYQISYKCSNPFSIISKEPLHRHIDSLNQSEIEIINTSIDEYKFLYRNFIYQK